jgi:hypothetical protein
MVFVEGNVMIFPAALDWAESSAPFGSAARMRIEGFMAFAARVTPEIKPPPIVQPKNIYIYASLETKLYHLHHKKVHAVHTTNGNNYCVNFRDLLQKLKRYCTLTTGKSSQIAMH